MSKKLYVGNLPFSATDQSLSEKFSACGTVESAKVITDRDSGQSASMPLFVCGKNLQHLYLRKEKRNDLLF